MLMLKRVSSQMGFSFNFFINMMLLASFLSFMIACDKNGNDANNQEIVFPDKNVSFYNHVQPLFERRCGIESGCHSPSDQPTTRNQLTYSILTTKDLLLNFTLSSTGEKLIDLNVHRKNPDIAPLYLILLEGYPEQQTDLMPPPPREPLNQNQLNGILQWIREGCPD